MNAPPAGQYGRRGIGDARVPGSDQSRRLARPYRGDRAAQQHRERNRIQPPETGRGDVPLHALAASPGSGGRRFLGDDAGHRSGLRRSRGLRRRPRCLWLHVRIDGLPGRSSPRPDAGRLGRRGPLYRGRDPGRVERARRDADRDGDALHRRDQRPRSGIPRAARHRGCRPRRDWGSTSRSRRSSGSRESRRRRCSITRWPSTGRKRRRC